MSTAFFVDWELWQKMVFVLGCALVLTVFGGLITLRYTHWRTRRYKALDKLADKVNIIREKSIIRSLSTKNVKKPHRQRSAREPVRRTSSTRIPFGIRALESGTQIEEVWDSRPNSRVVSQSDLYTASNLSTVDLDRPVQKKLAREQSSNLTSEYESEDDTAQGHIASPPSTRAIQPVQGAPPGPRNRYPPHSYMRYEGSRGHKTTNSFRTRASEKPYKPPDHNGPQQALTASSFVTTTSNVASDNSSPAASPHLRPSFRSDLPQWDSLPAPGRSVSADSIRAMQQRRLSQVAETGYLLPRFRSDEFSHRSASEHPVIDTTHDDRMSFEADASGEDSDSRYFSTPSVRVTASTPQFDGEDGRQHRKLRKRSAVTPSSTPHSSTFSVSSRRSSEVLRRVNSGFAVLRPGSIETQLATPQSARTGTVRSSSTDSGPTMSVGERRGRRIQKRVSEERASKRGSSHE